MPTQTVQQGDCVSSIAINTGFFWQTIWDRAENADLKTKRKDPNILMEGDQIFVPDLTPKTETRPTEKRHVFRRKGTPAVLRLQLLDGKHEPRPNLPYTLTLPGLFQQGTTDAQGYVTEHIPPDAASAILKVTDNGRTETFNLNLGHTNPIDDVSGVKQRLRNLGFRVPTETSDLDQPTQDALKLFQAKYNIPATGNICDATKSMLQKAHGS